jgi:N6-adenosine-specific RNA methylase IME4
MEEKKYKVIYADPPWRYRVYSKKGLGRSAESHYPTMEIDDIRDLPVDRLADKDCALFMWVTMPCLVEGLSVLKSWGFTYKTIAFVWVKQNKKADSLFWGMGYWTRSNVEFCILATKGSPKRESAAVHQVIMSHIEEHSKKPQEARDRIVQLMGDVPRIELFARQVPDGWDVWGNEVPCDILMEGSEDNGVCAGSEGLDESQNQGDVQPDKETADLLLSGSGSGTALLPAY